MLVKIVVGLQARANSNFVNTNLLYGTDHLISGGGGGRSVYRNLGNGLKGKDVEKNLLRTP